jgi:hypothetical protein
VYPTNATSGSRCGPLSPNIAQRDVQCGDALCDPAPVDFEFGLTGSARSDSAAEAREFGAGPDQIRLTVAQLREFDLHLPFAAASVARKDVQNQHRAIHDRQWNDFFEILSLPRAQVVENQEQVGAFVVRPLRDLAGLSTADQRRGIHGIASLYDALEDLRSGRPRKRLKLIQLPVDFGVQRARLDRDDNRSLRHRSGLAAMGLSRSTSQRIASL